MNSETHVNHRGLCPLPLPTTSLNENSYIVLHEILLTRYEQISTLPNRVQIKKKKQSNDSTKVQFYELSSLVLFTEASVWAF